MGFDKVNALISIHLHLPHFHSCCAKVLYYTFDNRLTRLI